MKQRIPTLDSYIEENYIKENNTNESFFSNMNVGQEAKTRAWLDRMGVKNYVINDDGTVDVNGSVFLWNKKITKIEVQFRNVKGAFWCYNSHLTSLEGAPKSVGEDFSCQLNQLTSLEGAPKSVGWNFYCNDNQLTSLKGAPKSVGGSFYCFNNKVEFTEEDVKKVCKVKGSITIE